MGAMKSLKMGKVLGTIRRKNTNSASGAPDSADPQGDGPEAIAARSVIAFCESGAPNHSGDEVLYLPPIVESAESSPQAAAECAHLIRKYMKKDYWSKPTYQYNALMLMRILADNPGPTFTRNVDQKFVDTVKELLRAHRSQQVDQMLFETLTVFETTKGYDEGLVPLIEMWKKEKEKAQKSQPRHMQQQQQQPPPLMMQHTQPFVANPHSQNYFARNHQSRKLPDAVELASRLEEARTSAKLLQQVVTNTPPGEILDNDLIKEFADRCTSATRSIQSYMSAEDPAPDNDTMESMIDTNEQLQAALSLHQRAVLNAKKQLGVGTPASEDSPPVLAVPQSNGAGSSRRPSPAPAAPDSDDDYEPPPMPPRGNGKGKEREYDNLIAGPSGTNTPRASEDPFADPQPETTANGAGAGGSKSGFGAGSSSRYQDEEPRFPHEPYHPGFNATPSYLGRQESALGKETMHGAVSDANERVPEESEDIYNTTPQKNKGPMYRY